MKGLQNFGDPVKLGCMRGVSFDLAFLITNKVTGAPVDLTGKTVRLRVYADVSGTETIILDLTASVPTPTSGAGIFAITATEASTPAAGVEHWYRGTIELAGHVDVFAWGPWVPEDGVPS